MSIYSLSSFAVVEIWRISVPKTKIFIGSSTAAKSQAKAVITHFKSPTLDFVPWWEAFTAGGTLLEDLDNVRDKVDAALLPYTSTTLVQSSASPRNWIFGLSTCTTSRYTPGRILITPPASGAAFTASWIVVKSAPSAPTVIVFGSCARKAPHAITTIALHRDTRLINLLSTIPIHLFDTKAATKTILILGHNCSGTPPAAVRPF